MRLLYILVLLFGIVSTSNHQVVVAAELSETRSLWGTAPLPSVPDPPPVQPKPWILRERDIAIDLPLLQILKDAAARPLPRVVIELFNGAIYELDITSTVSRFNDTAVIRGVFTPPAQGEFTFIASGNLLVGTIQLGNRTYKIDHIANGRLKLLELDPEKMPPD